MALAAPFFLVIVPDPRETAEMAETAETAETAYSDAIGATVGFERYRAFRRNRRFRRDRRLPPQNGKEPDSLEFYTLQPHTRLKIPT